MTTRLRRTRTPSPPPIDAAWGRVLARKLLAWYERHRRALPWRQTSDPYRVWVSEIMLQQTQVATVVPYFERFLAAFPSVHALAAADEHDVLRLWEGLGYYRRARQMHRAAQQLCTDHGGVFPQTLEAIQTLPGIGRYTAGAIASIAFGLRAPILEANTVRLYSRLIAFRGEANSPAGQQALWKFAADILPREHCGAFNQALMELGSQVCTPRAPNCPGCPLKSACSAYQLGCQSELPKLKPKPASEELCEASVVVYRGGRVLLRRCGSGERWAGLWDFLRFAVDSDRPEHCSEELVYKARELSGLDISPPTHLTRIRHGVTRFRITLDCYEATTAGAIKKLKAGEWQWAAPKELGEYALSTTGRKLARLIAAE